MHFSMRARIMLSRKR